jgi:hypothetical protein
MVEPFSHNVGAFFHQFVQTDGRNQTMYNAEESGRGALTHRLNLVQRKVTRVLSFFTPIDTHRLHKKGSLGGPDGWRHLQLSHVRQHATAW